MKRASNTILLTFAIIVTIAVAGIYAYMLHSAYNSVDQSAAAREAVASAQMSKSREQSFMQLYQSTADSWAKLPGFFIPSNDILSFINSIEALGPQTGASTTIASIDADNLDSASPGKLGSIRSHVTAVGSWNAVTHVLALVEVMPYKSIINNVKLALTGSDKSRHTWELSFDINAGMIAVGSSTPSK